MSRLRTSTDPNSSENSYSDMTRGRIIARALLVLYRIDVAVMCFARISTGIDMSSTWFGLPPDKIVHFTMFLPYTALVYLAFYRPGKRPWHMVLFLAATVAAGCLIAGGTELIQGELQYRSADIDDFRADSIGIFTGSVITLIWAAAAKKW